MLQETAVIRPALFKAGMNGRSLFGAWDVARLLGHLKPKMCLLPFVQFSRDGEVFLAEEFGAGSFLS